MASKTESRRSKKKGKKIMVVFFAFSKEKKENLNKMKSLNDNKCQRFRFFRRNSETILVDIHNHKCHSSSLSYKPKQIPYLPLVFSLSTYSKFSFFSSFVQFRSCSIFKSNINKLLFIPFYSTRQFLIK